MAQHYPLPKKEDKETTRASTVRLGPDISPGNVYRKEGSPGKVYWKDEMPGNICRKNGLPGNV